MVRRPTRFERCGRGSLLQSESRGTDAKGLAIGKQARVVDESSRAKRDNSPTQQQPHTKATMTTRATEPVLGTTSAGQGHADPTQFQAIDGKAKQHKRVPDENIAKLVAEENESRSKFPHYPGLERWELVEKMGDGAFSNVYRARDREGTLGEVAIKVVRKFEMNSMQVRDGRKFPRMSLPYLLSLPSCSLFGLSGSPFTDSS